MDARIRAGLVPRKAGVQPHHVHLNVVPQRESSHVPAIQRFTHALVATLLFEVVHITEQCLLVLAHLVGNGVVAAGEDGHGGALEDISILDVEAPDLGKVALVGAVGGEELSHHSHGPGGVHHETRALPIKAGVAHAERIDVAAILVADAVIALTAVVVPAFGPFAHVLPWSCNVAGVRCIRRGHVVRLPDVHLRTAGPVVPDAHVVAEIFGIRHPTFRVRLAANEFDVMGALCITVAGAVLGPSVVVADPFATVWSHLREVHGSVHAALDAGRVHL
mmetsp:Transcript_15219/g.36014  ORF Transcript_15219/g.36014 Transcript_15219/m.36014 type:complete len:277 (-) Transcript_15219:485-1315(-)